MDGLTHEFSSLRDLLVLAAHPRLEFDDLGFDLRLPRAEGLPIDVSRQEKVEETVLLGGQSLQPLSNELRGVRAVLLLAVDFGFEESFDLVFDVVRKLDLSVDVLDEIFDDSGSCKRDEAVELSGFAMSFQRPDEADRRRWVTKPRPSERGGKIRRNGDDIAGTARYRLHVNAALCLFDAVIDDLWEFHEDRSDDVGVDVRV